MVAPQLDPGSMYGQRHRHRGARHRRQGPEVGGARIHLERRHRRRLDRAGLQPGREPRPGDVSSSACRPPAIMLLAFVPMLFIASSYYYLNRADPDCGTTFSWVTRAMGPHLGWMGGWGIIAADVIVMANLAQIAGQYTFYLFGADSLANSKWWSLALGVAVDRGHDLDLLRRHRGIGQDAVVPARRRGGHPRHLRRGGAAQGVLLEPPRRGRPVVLVDQPVRHQESGRSWPTASSWRCSSTGAGTALSR